MIHIGQAIMTPGGPAESFINNLFNFSTPTGALTVATYNGLNKMAHKR